MGRNLWILLRKLGSFKDFLHFISEPVLLEWATSQIEKDTEQEAEDFIAKFDILKPWINLQLWDHLKKQEDKFEEKKQMVAQHLKLHPSKINITNAFDEKIKSLGLPQEALDQLLGNNKDG